MYNFNNCHLCLEKLSISAYFEGKIKWCEQCYKLCYLCEFNQNEYWFSDSNKRFLINSNKNIGRTIISDLTNYSIILNIKEFYDIEKLDKYHIDKIINKLLSLKTFS